MIEEAMVKRCHEEKVEAVHAYAWNVDHIFWVKVWKVGLSSGI